MKNRSMRQYITFQQTKNGLTWEDYYSCHAYRYCPQLMGIIPSTFRIVDHSGTVYELISPADDIMLEHKTVKFRGKRVTSA